MSQKEAYKQNGDAEWRVQFLLFYEKFVWSNKRVKNIPVVFDRLFMVYGLRLPELLEIGEAESEELNLLLVENSEAMAAIKTSAFKLDNSILRGQSEDTFRKLADSSAQFSSTNFLFRTSSLLVPGRQQRVIEELTHTRTNSLDNETVPLTTEPDDFVIRDKQMEGDFD